jgi:hypothetical protein
MDLFQTLALLHPLMAVCADLNHRCRRLPASIGGMLIALAKSPGLVAAGLVEPSGWPGPRMVRRWAGARPA